MNESSFCRWHWTLGLPLGYLQLIWMWQGADEKKITTTKTNKQTKSNHTNSHVLRYNESNQMMCYQHQLTHTHIRARSRSCSHTYKFSYMRPAVNRSFCKCMKIRQGAYANRGILLICWERYRVRASACVCMRAWAATAIFGYGAVFIKIFTISINWPIHQINTRKWKIDV